MALQFQPEQVSYIEWQKEERRQQRARLDTFDASIMRHDWRKADATSRSLASEGRYAQASAWKSHAAALKAILDAHAAMTSGAAAAKAAEAKRDFGAAKEHRSASLRGKAEWASLLSSLSLHEPSGVYEADFRADHGVVAYKYQSIKQASHGGVVRMPELLNRAEWKEVKFARRLARGGRKHHTYIDEDVDAAAAMEVLSSAE